MRRQGTGRDRKRSESVRISGTVKRRLQQHCRENDVSLRAALEEAVDTYVRERFIEEGEQS